MRIIRRRIKVPRCYLEVVDHPRDVALQQKAEKDAMRRLCPQLEPITKAVAKMYKFRTAMRTQIFADPWNVAWFRRYFNTKKWLKTARGDVDVRITPKKMKLAPETDPLFPKESKARDIYREMCEKRLQEMNDEVGSERDVVLSRINTLIGQVARLTNEESKKRDSMLTQMRALHRIWDHLDAVEIRDGIQPSLGPWDIAAAAAYPPKE